MTQKEFNKILDDWNWYHSDMTWDEYYKTYINLDYVKGDHQRNYQRNDDLVYHTNNTKANNRSINYVLGDLEAPYFELLDNGNLIYHHDTYGAIEYNKKSITQLISPFAYMSMWVDDNLDLIADVPIVIYGDTEFEFNEYGNLIIKNSIGEEDGTN